MHQWHHSSERIDIWSAVRTHPLELPLFHIVGLIAFAVVFNLSKETSGGLMTFLLLIQYIQHTNVKTPRWLGYIIVRLKGTCCTTPEKSTTSRLLDLPIVDMLFGTFENPIEPLPNLAFGTAPPPVLSITFYAGTMFSELPESSQLRGLKDLQTG